MANTDVAGFWDDVSVWLKLKNFDVTVVGTGGAARGVLAGILAQYRFAARASNVRIWSRKPTKVKKLTADFQVPKNGNSLPCLFVIWCLPPLEKKAVKQIWSDISSDKSQKYFLYDLNYGQRALPTAGLVLPHRRRTGIGMLERQAKAAFELWKASSAHQFL